MQDIIEERKDHQTEIVVERLKFTKENIDLAFIMINNKSIPAEIVLY